jgi:hypothetical protein
MTRRAPTYLRQPIAPFIDDGHDLALQEGTCDNTPQAISLL